MRKQTICFIIYQIQGKVLERVTHAALNHYVVVLLSIFYFKIPYTHIPCVQASGLFSLSVLVCVTFVYLTVFNCLACSKRPN